MRRKRFQKGSLQLRRHGRHRVWVASWWDDGNRRSKVLGRCSQMGKGEAEAVLSDILRPINSGIAQGPRVVYTFKQFVEGVYLPFCRRTWKESTKQTSEQLIKAYLLPEFGEILLHALRREQMQGFLERMALRLTAGAIDHLRWFLNAIFRLALSDGVVINNPASELRRPKNCLPGRFMRPLSGEEVSKYLSALDLREKLIARLAIFEGMRPGEILALRWSSFKDGAFRVEQRVYHGVFDTPKNGKDREGALSDGTTALLQEWSTLRRDPAPDAFVFPNEKLTKPVLADNLWHRMQSKLKEVGLAWATFQVLRKTNASLSKKAGVDPKISADQRGHGVGVSLAVYTSSDLEQKRQAVNRLEQALTARTRL